MRIRRNRDNKIKIPWYRRRVTIRRVEQVDFIPADFGFRFPFARARPQPVRVADPVTQPATEPVMEPGRVPVRAVDPTLEPIPVPEPFPGVPGIPVPEPFPGIPLPGRVPGQPFPDPEGEAPSPPFREPIPVPGFITEPEYDWEAHYRRIAEQYEQTMQGREEPMSDNPFMKAFEMIAKPIVYLTIGKAMLDHYVEAKITDPIYSKMLETPVLGDALREAEKAGMDVEALANYFANYDWDNMDTDEMLKDLTAIVGAAGAARLIVFFIGRRVVFRI